MLEKYDSAFVASRIQDSINVKKAIINDNMMISQIIDIAKLIYRAINDGGTLYVCGNGGSASDALHIAGEIVGRFQLERKGYAAVALNTDVSVMTAITNDYGYEQVFSRQVEALMKPRDLLLGISTSGNSKNIVAAFNKAKELGTKTILLSGKTGGILKDVSDYYVIVPSDNTARIQESHMCIYHILCEMVEGMLAGKRT